jgi:succinyl-CoA synthetase alpha subunit
VEGDRGSARGKITALKAAGIQVAESFSDIATIARQYL